MPNHQKDLTGKVDGFLTVLGSLPDRGPRGDVIWLVRCACGKEFTQRSAELFRKNKSREGQVPHSCGCMRHSKRVYTSKYGGVGHLSGHKFGSLQTQARHRGHDFTVTIEYLWNKFVEQEGLCVLTGVPLCLSRKMALPGESMASLDRVSSDLGYIPGNVQWVHPTVNFMKHAMPQEQFIAWCRLVAGHSRSTG